MTHLHHGNCFDIMPTLAEHSVNLILTDLPYNTLHYRSESAKWDNSLPLDKLWAEWKRLLVPGGCVVLFGQGMFTAELMMSNRRWWKYNLIWKKGNRPTGFLNAKHQPMRLHEDIIVFCSKATVYNPQFTLGNVNHSRGNAGNAGSAGAKNRCYDKFKQTPVVITNEKYPVSVLDFAKESKPFHPTQKPVALCEWLVRTYTNEGDVVLDCCMGAGSVGVAAKRNRREFIGIEIDEEFFKIAKERIDGAIESML